MDNRLIDRLREERVRIQECYPEGSTADSNDFPGLSNTEFVIIPQDTEFDAFNDGDSITTDYTEEAGGFTVTVNNYGNDPEWHADYFLFDGQCDLEIDSSEDAELWPPWGYVTQLKPSAEVTTNDRALFISPEGPRGSSLKDNTESNRFAVVGQHTGAIIAPRLTLGEWVTVTFIGTNKPDGLVKVYIDGILQYSSDTENTLTDTEHARMDQSVRYQLGSGGGSSTGFVGRSRGAVFLDGLREDTVFAETEKWRRYWNTLAG